MLPSRRLRGAKTGHARIVLLARAGTTAAIEVPTSVRGRAVTNAAGIAEAIGASAGMPVDALPAAALLKDLLRLNLKS